MYPALRRLAVLLLVSALAGCAVTYRSPDLPAGGESQIAVVEPEKYEIGPDFYISRIDGKPKDVGMISRIELTPGRHSITASVNPYTLRGPDVTKYFNAKAGRKYLVVFHQDVAQRLWGFSIVEAATKTRVDEPY